MEFSREIELAGDIDTKKGKEKGNFKGPVGSFNSLVLKGVKEPALDRVSVEDDTIPRLSDLIEGLFSPSGDSDGTPSKLREFVEGQIRSMKKSEGKPTREAYLLGLKEISTRGRDVFIAIRKLKRDKIDPVEAENLLRRAFFYIIVQGLYMVEITSKWSDPVVNTWDPLRIERQHMIKSSVQRLFNVTDRMIDLRRSSIRRWEAYNVNLRKRRNFRSLSMMETKMSREVLSGLPGGSWDILVSFRSSPGSENITFTPYLSLPRGGWALESPSSMREGSNLVLKEIRIGPGERRDIEFKIRAPSNPGVGERARIYLHLEDMDLEVEE